MTWEHGLLLFGLCWALQIAGTALQMRHYRKVLGGLTTRWGDGFIGSGSARARFGRGALTILVVAPSGIVREALVMQGRTVWAKFKPMPALAGIDIEAVRNGAAFTPRDARLAEAFRHSVEQIDRIAEGRMQSAAVSV
jgi:glucitol operon activator protein